MFKILTTLPSEMEATLARGRLTEAGIRCMPARPELDRSAGRERSVYVEAEDLERARAALKADVGSFSDEELTRLSEESEREALEGAPSAQASQPE